MRLDVATIGYLADRERRNCNPATVAYYGKLLKWLGDYLATRGVVNLEDITTRLLEDYIADLKRRPLQRRNGRLSPVSIRKWTLSLKTFFAWAAGAGHISDDPARLVPLPKQPQRLPKALSAEQTKTLLAAQMRARERAIISLMLDSGIRLSECVALDITDVDDDLMTVLVRKGKGGKQRVIVFADETRHALRTWLKERATESQALFVTEKGTRVSTDAIYKAIKQVASSVGLSDLVSPHKLRHTFATLYLDGGGAIQDASAILGHSSLTMTMVYTHIATAGLRRKHQQYSPLNGLKK